MQAASQGASNSYGCYDADCTANGRHLLRLAVASGPILEREPRILISIVKRVGLFAGIPPFGGSSSGTGCAFIRRRELFNRTCDLL
jgi:hypothetical protein